MSEDNLYGREGELAAIGGVLDAVARGQRRLLVIRGEAGIGKTRLLAALQAEAAAQRFVVLDGRATELERDVPLVPVADALERRLPVTQEATLRELGPERLALLGEVLEGLPTSSAREGGASGPRASGTERWRLHRALGELLAVIGEGRPTALVIDDVHWADPATLELLEHLVRRPPPGAHLLALGLRPGPAADRLLAAQRSSAETTVVTIDLWPLERGAADGLLTGVAVEGERERLYAQSGGNPLLLQELARDGGARGVPGTIVAAVAAEAQGLPAAALALVEAAAIAGDPFDLDVAAGIAGLGPTAVLEALDVVTQHALVRATADPRRFAFRHPVVRTAIYEGIPAGARLAGHAAAARELAHAGAALPVRARHLAHAATRGDRAAAATLIAAS
ncbi:MAG: transcriptional regulator, LuxR family, partial [Solirubrobacterales bacterium]|nr:transcriptional regulator, LuxR family [Solirubrobacterales bacterium]